MSPSNHCQNQDRVLIFDTTLRDGEQSPGASMNLAEKVQIAGVLAELGVDVIEAGFPIASPGDFEAVQAIARQVSGPVVAGLARCCRPDIERAWEALRDGGRRRIHTFLATSPIHREHKLRMSREQVIARVTEGVARARDLCADVEFSAEDAARTEPEFLAEVIERAIEAGAGTVNIPDTVGYAMPSQFAELIAYLKTRVANIERAVISVHCHNDLGMAVANSLAAVAAGARQVECTINGLGERAGNCSLEEAVMALRVRRDLFGLHTGVHTPRLYAASQLVAHVTGVHVQRNKAVVGRNAFAHEAGIHQHGVLMNQETYEIMKPEDVGVPGNDLVLGKHSGRHAFRQWLDDQGYRLDDARFEKAFADFKAVADRKKEVYEADLHALVEGGLTIEPGPWEVVSAQANAGTGTIPIAAVALRNVDDGVVVEEAACGSGPVDAVYKAIERIVGLRVSLRGFHLRSLSHGKDAMGDVSIDVEVDGERFRGHAASVDIIEASAKALLRVVNRCLHKRRAAEPQSLSV